MAEIEFKINASVAVEMIIELYESAGLARPVDDKARIEKMYTNSNLVISAWDGARIVGVARAITDFSWCCYLMDLAVRKDVQHSGVGRKLVEMVRETVGENSNVLLLSAPEAVGFYPKIGMEKVDSSFIFKRRN